MYNNVDQAYTIPQNNAIQHLTDQLVAQDEKRRLQSKQQAKDDENRQTVLAKYVGDQFKDKNYLTGTGYDPVINEQASRIRQKYIGEILKDPKTNFADLDYRMQNDMGQLASTAAGIKSVKDNVDKQATVLGKYQGIDVNAAKQLAMTKFLYDIDPKTGARTLKDQSKLDPNQDYMAAAINDHPELIAQGDLGVRNAIKGFQNNVMAGTNQGKSKGVTTRQQYSLTAPVYMQEKKDENGNVVDAEVRHDTIPGINNPDGTPMKIASQHVFDAFNTDPATSVYLAKRFKDYNSKLKTPLDPNSEAANIVKKKILYDDLTENTPIKRDFKDIQNQTQLADKLEMGIPLYKQGMSDAEKLLKSEKKLDGLDPGLIFRSVGGEGAALEGAEPVPQKDGSIQYDITNLLGGMKMGKNEDGTPLIAKSVTTNPITKQLFVTAATGKDGADEKVPYKGKDLRKFVLKHAEENGVSYDKAVQIADNFTDKEGNYKPGKIVNDQTVSIAADQKIADLNARKTAKAKAELFQTSGKIGDLAHVAGVKTLDANGKPDGGIILDVNEYRGLFGSPYTITIQKGDKTQEVPLKTKDEVTQYILQHTQKK